MVVRGTQAVNEESEMAEERAENERELMSVDPERLERASRRTNTRRGREMVARALANPSLMAQAYDSLAAHKRSEKGTPGWQVHGEDNPRRGGV